MPDEEPRAGSKLLSPYSRLALNSELIIGDGPIPALDVSIQARVISPAEARIDVPGFV